MNIGEGSCLQSFRATLRCHVVRLNFLLIFPSPHSSFIFITNGSFFFFLLLFILNYLLLMYQSFVIIFISCLWGCSLVTSDGSVRLFRPPHWITTTSCPSHYTYVLTLQSISCPSRLTTPLISMTYSGLTAYWPHHSTQPPKPLHIVIPPSHPQHLPLSLHNCPCHLTSPHF